MSANIASTFQEVDPMVKRAMKLLHSSHPNSATELRLMLDEAIKQRYGPEKMISNQLSQRHLDEEANFPGRAVTPPPLQPITNDEIINLTNSPAKTISDSPDTIMDSDDGLSGTAGVSLLAGGGDGDDGNLKDFGDLNCCVCGEMVFTATNRLIECSKCGSLYHQECHKPPITDEEASEDQEHNWQCDSCSNKPTTSKATAFPIIPEEPIPLVNKTKSSVASSRSSTSSNSSSPFYKPEQTTTNTSSGSNSSKHTHKSSSSSSKSSTHTKEERGSKSTAPAVNIIGTGSEKSHSSSSKRSTHSTKSSSSSKSTTKHHDSSSKRRSNK